MNGRLGFFLIVLAALLVRVGGLHQMEGLWFDEALNGVDAWLGLHETGLLLVYPDIFPREPLYVWLLTALTALFGPSLMLFRLFGAFLGALCCGFFFLMVRRTDRQRGLPFALATAFVLATLHWHGWFSRLLFRTNLVPLLAVSAIALLTAAAQKQRRSRWLLLGAGGAVTGLGFYTYLSWYFFLPVLAFYLVMLAREQKGVEKKRLSLYPLAAAALVVLPLLLHYFAHPGHLFGRPQAVSPFQDGYLAGLKLLAANLWDVALMFSFRGDHVPLHNVADFVPPSNPRYGKTGSPVFGPAWSLLFYAGLLSCLRGALGREKSWRDGGWLLWLACMSLPSVLSQTDSANTLRNLGTTPAVAYMTGRGFFCLRGLLSRKWPHRPRLVLALVMALFLTGVAWQLTKIWVLHPRQPSTLAKLQTTPFHLARFAQADANGARLFVPPFFTLSVPPGERDYTFIFLTLGREDIQPFSPQAYLTANPQGKDHRLLCTPFFAPHRRMMEAAPAAYLEEAKLLQGETPFSWILRLPAKGQRSPAQVRQVLREKR